MGRLVFSGFCKEDVTKLLLGNQPLHREGTMVFLTLRGFIGG